MNNIVLIGMPSAGKSTVGVLLAKSMLYSFTDTDLLLQSKYSATLCDIIEARGEDAFIRLENDLLASLNLTHAVIATGGSAVYGEEAMEHLREIGVVVYLKLDLAEIKRRIGNIHTRGVVLHHTTTLEQMYEERCALYEKYAHITVDCCGKNTQQTLEAILTALGN
jgi:shikimate kinase